MGHLDLHPIALHRLHHAICIGQAGSERLLMEDVASGLGGSSGHGRPLVQPTWSDSHDVQLLAVQHPAVVGVIPVGARAFFGLGPALVVRVRHRDHIGIVKGPPNRVEPVPVVAAAGVADHADAILFTSGPAHSRQSCQACL